MKKRILLIILLCTFFMSTGTLYLIWNYIDPYEYPFLGITLLLITFILTISSFFSVLLYFIKKIYFRGKVYVQNVLYSFRQGFLISLFLIGIIYFQNLGASVFITALPLGVGLFFLELFFQNLQD